MRSWQATANALEATAEQNTDTDADRPLSEVAAM
jgi:hypothetical protein